MSFEDVLNKRYSCRKYDGRDISREQLEEVMEAGRIAPSACNAQRWMFIGVNNREKTRAIGNAMKLEEMRINTFAEEVPAFIVLAEHPIRRNTPSTDYCLGNDESNWRHVDIGIAAAQMMLKATAMELGCVAIGMYDKATVREILDIPEEQDIPLIIGLGYPKEIKERKHIRYEPEEVFRFNSYNEK